MNYLNSELSPQERAEALADMLTTEQQAEQLSYDAPPIPSAGLPAYNWWNEGLHGVARAGTATVFPQAIALAAAFDRELMRRVGTIIATETRAKYNAAQKQGDCDIYKGLTLWTPNINIFRDPRWGRGHETYGECPYLTSELGVEMVKGLQGEGKHLSTAACAKHFAVHSGPESLRHEFNATVSPKDMEETYLPAFKALVTRARVEGVMGAYNRVNGEPACASAALFKKLEEWGFDGYFVSDCWAIRDFHEHHMVTATAPKSAAMALKAGCDVNCGNTYLHLLSALKQGLITPEDIRKACVHALRTRIRLGQLDKTEYDDIPFEKIACAEHKAAALECAEKSAVLLENNGILPLSREIRTLAVIGPNANSRAALYGNYNGTADRCVTFLEGIQDRFDGRVLYAEGCHLYKDRTQGLVRAGDRLAEAVSAAECADAVILCLGLDATLEGEEGDTSNEFSSGDKNDLRLPESQRILLEKVRAVGKPTVVVLAAGSSVNIESGCDALIDMWYPGQCGGTALAKILFGDISPSGKLPVTFYKSADKLPDFTDYSMKNRTYRYCSADNILYPFGYGLTYSRFECGNIKYSAGSVEVTVANVGDRFTEDVLQLYISSETEGAPRCSLCGFKRISLNAGESATVTLPLDDSAFEIVD
ncbi:MAG: glycoside hydrolase family 3 C-terminal domain-containing protein, partial [Oscillospiraceae bacterium]|nr:glycoside hydrolase family 3 C-terminal domain-containing protein [Oscillospiraceae bacterium]